MQLGKNEDLNQVFNFSPPPRGIGLRGGGRSIPFAVVINSLALEEPLFQSLTLATPRTFG